MLAGEARLGLSCTRASLSCSERFTFEHLQVVRDSVLEGNDRSARLMLLAFFDGDTTARLIATLRDHPEAMTLIATEHSPSPLGLFATMIEFPGKTIGALDV